MKQTDIESAFEKWKYHTTPRSSVQTAAVKANKETSRLNLEHPDVCPYCHQKMRISQVASIPVYVCDEDRNVAPCPDNVSTDVLV